MRILHVEIVYYMSWNDQALQWNVSDWSNITELQFNNDELWFPQFEHITHEYEAVSSLSCDNPRFLVHNLGRIIYVPICNLRVKCSPDYTRYPYNTMYCHTWFSNHDKELVDEINFLPLHTLMIMHRKPALAMWCLMEFNASDAMLDMPGATRRTVQELRFNLQHTPHSALATIYFPTFVLIMLNMFICWLQSLASERIKIILLSLVCHFRILDKMTIYSSTVVPDVVVFIIASMVLTILLFAITLMLRWLNDLHATPPRTIMRWMKHLNNMRAVDWFLRTEYLSLGHKPVAATNYVELRDWPTIVKLADRCVLVLYGFIYLLLFWMYIPLQHDKYNFELDELLCSN
ncbi:acetylcholine receptor subunit beta-type lev-1-like isoform X2 [Anopheles stephensi]|nr:acetylcholine receptor subunit beta-type lev-1-like isoform X2 [Anopheles stephensi]